MRTSLIASVILHASILIWALVELPFARELDVKEMPSLPIDIITPSEFTKIKAGVKDAKTDEPTAKEKPVEKPSEAKKEAPEKKVTAALAPAPAPEPEPEAEPVPKPKKAEEPKPEPKPEPKKAEAAPPPLPTPTPPKPKVVKKPKTPKKVATKEPPKKKSDFNADRIAALLNKVPDAGPKAAPTPTETKAKPQGPARGQTSGQDLTMSINELDALRAKISQCWIPPVGGMGADAIKVRLRLQLNQDGSLTRQPEVVNREASPFFQVAADSAVRAVWQCQPYELPVAKYALWRDMILNFDPREMFGG